MDDPFARIVDAAEETWRDARYRWDNAQRPQNDACVVQRTLAGRVQFTARGQSRFAGPGEALLFTHREASVYRYPPADTVPYQLQFVAFFPGALRPFFDSLRREFGAVVRMPAQSEAVLVLDEILRAHAAHRFRDRLQVSELIGRLLFSLHREQIAAKQLEDPIEYGYRLLHDGAASPRGLKDIARLAGITREHFVREYSRRYGTTPGAALRQLRLEKAKAMILASSHSLADIAAACGFGSGDALRRSFERQFGKKPLALRRR